VDDDLIVVAGDNLFSDKLGEFGKFCLAKNAPALAVYDVGNLEEIKKYNSISTDARAKSLSSRRSQKIPQHAHRHRAVLLSEGTIALIKQYIAEGNNPDQPGRLVQWLYPRTPVYTWRVPGLWFDIGSKETLEEANQIFAKF
jgi:glucose-1-phosphate thymidylyltransferase